MISQADFKSGVLSAGYFDCGWVKFSIKFKSTLQYDGDNCQGLTHFDTFEIIIKDNKSVKALRMVLLHEIWHVLLSTMGVKDPDEDETKPLTYPNEYITEQCARSVVLAQRLNPELWSLLTDNKNYEDD